MDRATGLTSHRIRPLARWAALVACLALAACGDTDRPDNPRPTVTTESPTTQTSEATTTTTTRPPLTTTTRAPLVTTTTAGATTTTTETVTTTTEATTTTTDAPTTTSTSPPATDTTEVAGAPAGATGDDDATAWWPWLLVGAALIGLIVFLATRGSRAAAAWRQQVAAALDEATRLATHLAAVAPEGAAMVARQDAAQLAALAATMSALAIEAKEEPAQRAIGSVRDQVQVLHGVVDGIAMGSTPPTDATLAYLREQATSMHSAAARARAEVLPPPATAGAPPA
ncbi:MAG: hypothetical protein ACJ739_00015 [Acidimicrobiales bacterium]